MGFIVDLWKSKIATVRYWIGWLCLVFAGICCGRLILSLFFPWEKTGFEILAVAWVTGTILITFARYVAKGRNQ
jgi:hypothetical protein